jgi:hypothetical protein
MHAQNKTFETKPWQRLGVLQAAREPPPRMGKSQQHSFGGLAT